jgi:hypothetical protein
MLGTCSDGSGLYWLQLPAPLTCRASGSMEGNTTAFLADAIWLSAAVRGPLEVFGYQSLAFNRGMSVLDLGKQVRGSHCSVITCLHRVPAGAA